MLPNEIFLSHSSLDEEFANEVVNVLNRHGVPVWYSETNIRGAQQWHDEIGAALRRCDWFILILSENSVASMWVKREVLFALNDNRFADRIVPIRYRDCDPDDLSWVLSQIQMIDFSQDSNEGFRRLLRTWGIGYKP